jgi:hypothetical protein
VTGISHCLLLTWHAMFSTYIFIKVARSIFLEASVKRMVAYNVAYQWKASKIKMHVAQQNNCLLHCHQVISIKIKMKLCYCFLRIPGHFKAALLTAKTIYYDYILCKKKTCGFST